MFCPIERNILQDKAGGISEPGLAEKYKHFGYSYDKIRRLRQKLSMLFGRNRWKEIIFEATEFGIIQKVLPVPMFVIENPTNFLIATVELMELTPSDKSHKQKQRDWKKKKEELGWK